MAIPEGAFPLGIDDGGANFLCEVVGALNPEPGILELYNKLYYRVSFRLRKYEQHIF